ncbi:phosphoribosyltransferase [Candidatus Litorirhabdus singularis]|uniref:phosphoribosyltransferase n=1 Tax=Candidatus Litorirhabdus singularis TaxID=2518993 RepID=UPI00242A8740|nr:phosphoribosyltransferase family protein [Candidatus Litorirhabdus singularis]
MDPRKTYISAQQLLDDSFALGLQILESGFYPDFIVGIWRGGAPVGIAVQELLEYFDVSSDHIAIRTSLYTGINETASQVQVHGLGYLIERAGAGSKVLLVDDVFDSGRSIEQVVHDIDQAHSGSGPELRVATPYYKPGNNRTQRKPDYYLHETSDWLVFPHELCGLKATELLKDKPGIDSIRSALQARTQSV